MKAFIVHRWDGKPSSDWYPWLKKELEKMGFEVFTPEMPNTSEPKIEGWVSHLKKVVDKLDEDTYFIGHSIGCQAIMRYLETLPKTVKIGGIMFVAGWFNLKNLENDEVDKIARSWLIRPINFSKIKEKTNRIIVFLSSNEPYNCIKENEDSFRNNLNAEVIIEKNKGHFTSDEGIFKIPRLLEELKKIKK